ncbi:hypothetical protein C446_12904 [Halobiforma nitratireducens JCM 10879]|uniref:Uncharacterized protein n=1 Tax=Halobiforma nitratireducens JCM 10879 TaxID=1227454 RepID=M0LQI8_9EURY|nr:hypothetical protein C446_12904 [Halobiforma nitratireducens JCM 10879]
MLASAVLLRYPALLWGRKTDDRAAAAVFAGGTSFGVMSLGYGVGETFQVGAAVLGFGLALLGMATGAWMADERQ